MSDAVSTQSAYPGTISPRNVDTVTYRVLRELPKPVAPVGGTFSAWPQGEVFACVSGVGLGLVKNSEISEWEEAGLIERVSRAPAALGGAGQASSDVAATPHAKNASSRSTAPKSPRSRPWTLPGAVAASDQG